MSYARTLGGFGAVARASALGEVASGSKPGTHGFPAFSWRLRRANGYSYREIDDEYKLRMAVALNNVNVAQVAIDVRYGDLFTDREAEGYVGGGPSAPYQPYSNMAAWAAKAVDDGYGVIVKEPGPNLAVACWATKKASVADAITVKRVATGVTDQESDAFVLWVPKGGWSDAKIDPRKPPATPVEPPTTPAPPGAVPAERRSALAIAIPALTVVAVVGGLYVYSRRRRRR